MPRRRSTRAGVLVICPAVAAVTLLTGGSERVVIYLRFLRIVFLFTQTTYRVASAGSHALFATLARVLVSVIQRQPERANFDFGKARRLLAVKRAIASPFLSPTSVSTHHDSRALLGRTPKTALGANRTLTA